MTKETQQIKAEIERLYKEAKEEPYNGRMEGRLEVLDKLDAFIDSLEEEPVSEDLEKAAIRIADEILPIAGREIWHGETEKNIERRKQIREGVKRGANWQKEQMLNDGIKCTIDDDIDILFADYTNFDEDEYIRKQSLKPGDKVKVIMIKVEE